MLRVILSLYFWLYFILSAVFYFPIALVIWLFTIFFDKKLFVLHQFSCFWASSFYYINPHWKVVIEGREKIKKGQVYVLVANHNSPEDILVLYKLYKHFKWVSKTENARVPIFGWNMYLNRYILVERSSRSSIRKMLVDCERNIKNGNSVSMFPEGTRSKNGKLGNFKEGAFKLAQNTKVGIIPIVIHGTENQIFNKRGLVRGKHRIIVDVQDEIPFESFKGKDSQTLTWEIRQLLNNKLSNLI